LRDNLALVALPLLMALYRTRSAAVFGIDAHLIDVEVDMYSGGNKRDFITVGMPDTAVRESRERIKSALINSGFGYPNKSVTISLAPANVRKEGAGFDLPMAMGILGAMGTVAATDQHLLAGELSLDGTLRPIRGALSMAVCAVVSVPPPPAFALDNPAKARLDRQVREMPVVAALQVTVGAQVKVIGIIATASLMMPVNVIPVLPAALAPTTSASGRRERQALAIVRTRDAIMT